MSRGKGGKGRGTKTSEREGKRMGKSEGNDVRTHAGTMTHRDEALIT